nr:hypothetical protein Q903MT_gene1322 [Picea sitchensis]
MFGDQHLFCLKVDPLYYVSFIDDSTKLTCLGFSFVSSFLILLHFYFFLCYG